MQRLEVSGAVRPIYGLLGVKRLRKGDSHLKHNSLTSTIPWLTQLAPYLLHIPAHGLNVGRYPPQPVSVL